MWQVTWLWWFVWENVWPTVLVFLAVSSECFLDLFSSLTCGPSVTKKSKHLQCSTKQSLLTSTLFLYAYLFCLCLSIVMLSKLTGCQSRWCVADRLPRQVVCVTDRLPRQVVCDWQVAKAGGVWLPPQAPPLRDFQLPWDLAYIYICTARNTYSWYDRSGHGSEFQQILKLHLCFWKLQTSAWNPSVSLPQMFVRILLWLHAVWG